MKKWEDSLEERLAASPEPAGEYLSVLLEENNSEALRLALQHVAKARGCTIAHSDSYQFQIAQLDCRA